MLPTTSRGLSILLKHFVTLFIYFLANWCGQQDHTRKLLFSMSYLEVYYLNSKYLGISQIYIWYWVII